MMTPDLHFEHEVGNLLQRVQAAERLLDRRPHGERHLTAELRHLFADVDAFVVRYDGRSEIAYLRPTAQLVGLTYTLKRRVDLPTARGGMGGR